MSDIDDLFNNSDNTPINYDRSKLEITPIRKTNIEKTLKENIKKYGFVDLFPKDDFYFSLEGAVLYYWGAKSPSTIIPPQDEINHIVKLFRDSVANKLLPVYSYHLIPKEASGEYILKRGDIQALFFKDHKGIMEPAFSLYFDDVIVELEQLDDGELMTQKVVLKGKPLASAISSAKSPEVRKTLGEVRTFHGDHNRYPEARELFDMGKQAHGYDDWDTFKKTYDRYLMLTSP